MKFNKASFKKDLIMKRAVELSLSIEDAAKQIDLTPDQLRNLEAGHEPHMYEFCKVCTWLKSSRPGKYFVAEAEPVAELSNDDEQTEIDKENKK